MRRKLKEDRRKELGLKPDGDHVYYVTAKLCNESKNTDEGLTFISESEVKKKEKNRIFTNEFNAIVKIKPHNSSPQSTLYSDNDVIIDRNQTYDKNQVNEMKSIKHYILITMNLS